MKAKVECGSCGIDTDDVEWEKACKEGCPVCGSHSVSIYQFVEKTE